MNAKSSLGRGCTMQALTNKSVISTLMLLIPLCCEAQSNVYSSSIYSGGTSYRTLCKFAFSFPPHHYKLTERSWYEDTNGLTLIDIRRKKAPDEVLRRSLEVECGSESFTVPLDFIPPKKVRSGQGIPGLKGSGDLARLVMDCATSRGGHVTTNTLPVIQMSWIRQSRELQEIIIVDGDRFAEVQRLLEQAYGAPDTETRSPVPIENSRTLTYTPEQIGVVLNLTGDSRQTIVSIIGERKP